MMTYFVFALVFGFLAYRTHLKSGGDAKIYAKLATLSLVILTLFFLYLGSYYLYIGAAVKNYYNDGYGVTYKYVAWNGTDNVTYSNTYFDQWDTRVGEYIAVQKADSEIITVFSNILPYLALILGGYLLWFYVETALFHRDRGVT